MRKALVAGVCLVAIAASAASSTAGAKRPKPILTLAESAPLTVNGRHFRPLERVRLTLSASGSIRVRRTRASAAGSFRVGFGDVDAAVDRCSGGFFLLAVGSEGSRAALSPQQLKAPPPDCPPAP
jgi:hypothetical protein